MQHVEELVEHRARVGEVDAEPFELVGLIARADAEHEPAAGEAVNHPDLGEHPGRLVERVTMTAGASLMRSVTAAQCAAMMRGEGQMQ